MKKIIFFISIFWVLFALGCNSKKVPENIIPPDSMKVVLFDFIAANEWNNMRAAVDTLFLKTKGNLKSYQQVLAVHHITKQLFDSSLNYYEQHPELFKALIDSVSTYGTRLKDSTNNTKPLSAPAKAVE